STLLRGSWRAISAVISGGPRTPPPGPSSGGWLSGRSCGRHVSPGAFLSLDWETYSQKRSDCAARGPGSAARWRLAIESARLGRAFLLRCGFYSSPAWRKLTGIPGRHCQSGALVLSVPKCRRRIRALSWASIRHGRGLFSVWNAHPGRADSGHELPSCRCGNSQLGARDAARNDLSNGLNIFRKSARPRQVRLSSQPPDADWCARATAIWPAEWSKRDKATRVLRPRPAGQCVSRRQTENCRWYRRRWKSAPGQSQSTRVFDVELHLFAHRGQP